MSGSSTVSRAITSTGQTRPRCLIRGLTFDASTYGGTVRVFYRPEEVQLGDTQATSPTITFSAPVQRIIRGLPLGSVVIGPEPFLTALVLNPCNREVARLGLRVGRVVRVQVPRTSVRILNGDEAPCY
jgi:hypothetical protein